MNYFIGIDLGTTNSVLSYKKRGEKQVNVLNIPQQIGRDLLGEKDCLPSFAFLPPGSKEWIVGAYAQEQALELPGRSWVSAKSWLTHPAIDPALPFEERLSCLDTLSLFLKTLKEAWNHQMPEPFNEQTVCVTVPASFDPSAMQNVSKALDLAEYPRVTFLEEPLAAFYAWLDSHEESWRSLLEVGKTLLVIDIGGGTTDFTLISVKEREGELTLDREKVGTHLLLGGDNLDHSLAHLAARRVGTALNQKQFYSCVQLARKMKEEIFSGQKKSTYTLHIPGSGSSLIGNALKVELSCEEAEKVLIEGYFPKVLLEEKLKEEKKGGLSTLSLPYAQDPRVTAHLAHFLHESAMPDYVLFNGGTLKGIALQNRILEQIEQWKGEKPHVLPDADFTYSVSKGAVSYCSILHEGGVRVRAGAARSYWIGVESSGLAIPGVRPQLSARCLVPKGLEEGSRVHLDEPFTLALGETKEFRFFCSETREGAVGEECSDPSEELRELPAIHAFMESDGESFALVRLKAEFSERGLLELSCFSDEGKEWKLSFDTRVETKEPAFAS